MNTEKLVKQFNLVYGQVTSLSTSMKAQILGYPCIFMPKGMAHIKKKIRGRTTKRGEVKPPEPLKKNKLLFIKGKKYEKI